MPFDLNAPRPLSVAQLADRWQCSQGLVRKLIRRGELHPFNIGTQLRITVAEVERFETMGMLRGSDGARK